MAKIDIGFRATMTLLLVASLQTAFADEPPAHPEPKGPPPSGSGAGPTADKLSITHGAFTPDGGKVTPYQVATGYMPLKDEQGKLRANFFYMAYTLGGDHNPDTEPATQPADNAKDSPSTRTVPAGDPKRPVMFVFNGGPGAASAWLHLGAVGPQRLDVPSDGTPPRAPFKVVENPYSWLPAADLVFVDPVNTGYSRAASPEQAKEFLGVREDISGMGEFIRLYLTKNQRWGSPVFLAGESYGTTRAAALSNYLQERVGVSVSGVILISTVLNFATLSPSQGNDLPFSLYLPSYAAVAWYHKKLDMNRFADLDSLLKQAEAFASGPYVSALAKGTSLSDAERQSTAKSLAEFTGLPVSYILECQLRIEPSRFEKQLLRSPDGEHDQVIGRFDGRIAGAPIDPAGDSQEYDPSLSGFYPAYTSAFNNYVRTTLKYDNDLPYEVLSNRVYPWNWKSGIGDEGGYLYVGDDLQNAMTRNPHLHLLVCSGHFDLATPYFATDYQINHLMLPPTLRKNVTQTYYPGGHMLYHVQEALQKLHTDVSTFIAGALKDGRN